MPHHLQHVSWLHTHSTLTPLSPPVAPLAEYTDTSTIAQTMPLLARHARHHTPSAQTYDTLHSAILPSPPTTARSQPSTLKTMSHSASESRERRVELERTMRHKRRERQMRWIVDAA